MSTLSITCLLEGHLGLVLVMWVCSSRPTLVVKLPTIWFISSPMTLLTSSEVGDGEILLGEPHAQHVTLW